METSPLVEQALFHIGPIPIGVSVVTTWAIMVVLTAVSWLGTRRANVRAGTLQVILEIVVEAVSNQIRDVIRKDPWPYVGLIGTLFIFLAVANLTAIVPGAKPPTAHIETPAALAAIVFLSVHYFGIRSLGPAGYLKRYIRPNVLLLPFNVLSEITRTFSLMIRLFGNIMSHEIVLAVVVLLSGLLLPIPFMLLGILIGLIQAYIFSVLATVFIAAAVGSVETG